METTIADYAPMSFAVPVVNLGGVERIPLGEGREFEVNGELIAVFRARDGRLYAVQAKCPHRAGALADGIIGAGKVVCPLHAFKFDLATGAPLGNDCAALKTYTVAVNDDGELLLSLQEVIVADLAGAKIVLLETRMNSELANLVRRHGGEPISVPAVREVTLDCSAEVAALLDQLSGGAIDFIVFQTGVGVQTLLNEAEKLGRKEELIEALRHTSVIARGPKPTAVLARNGLKPDVAVPEPFTTTDLLAAMEPLKLKNKTVAVLHYGERNVALAESLTARGAQLQELCLYEWFLPEDTTRLTQLIDEIIHQAFTAIAFTSQIQARHLFQLAEGASQAEALRDALNNGLIVASVGPTCSTALQALGVTVRVEPGNPKMGPLVLALAAYMEQR